MATLAFFAEACLYMHVVLFDALSLRPGSVFTLPCAQKHQTAMLVASSAICGSVRVSGAVHVFSNVDTDDSRGPAKQPVKRLNLSVGRPTSCLYRLVAPFM